MRPGADRRCAFRPRGAACRAAARGATAGAALLFAAACGPAEEAPPPEIRPVRTVTVEELPGGETIQITGRIEAEEEVALAFRAGGRMIERTVSVGDRVAAGQRIGRVESVTAENAVQAARANLAAATARASDARIDLERQQALLRNGVTPRAVYDRAAATRQAADAAVDAARAQLDTTREQLGHTELVADAPGSVTAVGAEPGEVVAAGQMIVRVARQGGRDAVFGVPARVIEAAAPIDPEVTVTLSSDPAVVATGRVRELSPQADPVTRTFAARVGLADPPEAMRLGSTVVGSVHLGGYAGIRVPAAALTNADGAPAVWLFDAATATVSLRKVDLGPMALDEIVVEEGLAPGDVVVTAGVQTLRPGQQVRLLTAP